MPNLLCSKCGKPRAVKRCDTCHRRYNAQRYSDLALERWFRKSRKAYERYGYWRIS